jgi:predicted cupin superfamily sugar epimerase
MDVATAVSKWDLAPHPEGGFFRETYRSPLTTVPPGWPGERALATAILYLLPAGEHSAWHRVRGDELWLWQGGAPMLLRIGAQTRQAETRQAETRQAAPRQAETRQAETRQAAPRQAETRLVGPDPAAAHEPQVLVPGGAWQSATPGEGAWSLVACLVTPGFDFADFELRSTGGAD